MSQFLINNDYSKQIRSEVQTVVEGTEATRFLAENAAQQEITSYLNSRYDIDFVFFPTRVWSPAIVYNFNDHVNLDADDYDAAASYLVNDLITFTDGFVYICISATTPGEDPTSAPAKWTQIAAQYSFYTALKTDRWEKSKAYLLGDLVALDGVRYQAVKDVPAGTAVTETDFWVVNTDTVAAGTLPTVTASWTAGDNRNELVVMYMIDLVLYHLHARINPRNIPDLRMERRDDAVSWLKMVIDPRKNMNPDLFEKTFADKSDTNVVWNSNTRPNNGKNIW